MELRAPEPPPSAPVLEEEEEGEQPPEPILLGPLLYLAEREGSEALLLPVAEWRDDAYHALPDEEGTPDLVERFPLGRWAEGTEFVLLHRGFRAGTLITDGSGLRDESTCWIRPATRGRVELRPEAAGATRYLAVRKEDVATGRLPATALRTRPFPTELSANQLQTGALFLARHLVPRANIPWPPAIPDLLRDRRQIGNANGDPLLAATYVFGDEPEVGSAMPSAYAFFTLARRVDDEWEPFWLWHQSVRDGKAVPRVLASGGVWEENEPELVLELFGAETRGLAILGSRDGEWSLLFRDECAPAPAPGAARTWP